MINTSSLTAHISPESVLFKLDQSLIFLPEATQCLRSKIYWKNKYTCKNKNEQGGILAGYYTRSEQETIAIVTNVLIAEDTITTPTSLTWPAKEDLRLLRAFYELQDEFKPIDSTNSSQELSLLGWWHTHPNKLPVYMSSIDMENHQRKYYRDDQYSVVLNPHTGIWKAYSGYDAIEVPCIMLTQDTAPFPAEFKGFPISPHLYMMQKAGDFFGKKKRNAHASHFI